MGLKEQIFEWMDKLIEVMPILASVVELPEKEEGDGGSVINVTSPYGCVYPNSDYHEFIDGFQIIGVRDIAEITGLELHVNDNWSTTYPETREIYVIYKDKAFYQLEDK